jgi:hypothetical protein
MVSIHLLLIEAIICCLLIVYGLVGFEIYKNYEVYYSILLTQLVELVKSKPLYLTKYLYSLLFLLAGAVATLTICVYYGLILLYSNDKLTYTFGLSVFSFLSIGLMLIGAYAYQNAPDDIVNFTFPIATPVIPLDIRFNIDTQSQSDYFRYSPIVGTYISSAGTALIAILLALRMPDCTIVCK